MAGGKQKTKDQKALVFGLGLLGGGVATTNWLIRHGYEVAVTDLKNEKQLRSSLKKIEGKVELKLGGHSEKDIENADMVVVNPDVSVNNPFIQLARKLHKTVANEATLFYAHWPKKTIAVTGTRGKTTTVNWINHLLRPAYKLVVTGNSFSRPLLKVADQAEKFDYAVTELPSFLLELFDQTAKPPDMAVITNLSQDHLNRHGSLGEYAKTKANIFKNQNSSQRLILNANNSWTDFFLEENPKAQIFFFSLKALAKNKRGVFYRDGNICWQDEGAAPQAVLKAEKFIKEKGEHNLENLLASVLAAFLAGRSWKDVAKRMPTLPAIFFRQELVFESESLKVFNDTTATSSEGGVAALKRFGGPDCFLITGGTDRQLDFRNWAETLKELQPLPNVVFLSGSATDKMLAELKGVIPPEQIKDTLKECWQWALDRAVQHRGSVILFSPASKSFEKFKNEYDRGRKFNRLVRALEN